MKWTLTDLIAELQRARDAVGGDARVVLYDTIAASAGDMPNDITKFEVTRDDAAVVFEF